MTVKVTLEFNGVDEAIVALGKLVGLKPVAPASAQSGSESRATPPATEAGAAPVKTRRTRADKGQERGPYGPRTTTGEPVASEPVVNAGASAPVAPAAAPVAPTQTAAPAAPSTVQAPTVPAAPAAAVPSLEDVQKAVIKMYGAKDHDATETLIKQFGVYRAKDLDPGQRSIFIARVDAIVDRGEAL